MKEMEHKLTNPASSADPDGIHSALAIHARTEHQLRADQRPNPIHLSRDQLKLLHYAASYAMLSFCVIAVILSVTAGYNTLYKGSGLVAGALVALLAYETRMLRWCLRSRFLILYGVFSFLSLLWIFLNPVASSRFSTITIFYALTSIVFIYVATTRQMWPIFYGFVIGTTFIFLSGGAEFSEAAADAKGQRFSYTFGDSDALNPNQYALLLICVLLLSLKILFVDKKPATRGQRRLRILHFGSAIFGGVLAVQQTIAVTGSRKGLVLVLIACAGTGLIYLARRFSLRRLFVGAFASAICLGGALVFLQKSAFFERFLTMGEALDGGGLGESSSVLRADMARKGIEMWLESPVWGHGIEYFQRNSGFYAYTHSTPIEILVSMGLLGALSFYAAMFAAGIGAFSALFSRQISDKSEAVWVLLVLTCLAFTHLTAVVAFGHLREFTIIIGVVAAYSYGVGRSQPLDTASSTHIIVARSRKPEHRVS